MISRLTSPISAAATASAGPAGGGQAAQTTIVPRRFGPPARVQRATTRRGLDYVLASLLLLVTLAAAFARLLAPYDPIQPTGDPSLPPGSPHHLLGTDAIGRDLLSRTLWGLQTTWFSALIVVACGLVIGGTIGVVAGASGGRLDNLLMRLTDLFLAHPGPLIVITIVAALGYGLQHTLIAVTIFWWPFYARMIRGEARSLVARPHFEAARLAGAGRVRLVTRHLLPGIVPTAVVAASLDITNAVLVLAGLSFLGLGQPQPYPELGSDAANNLGQLLLYPWIPIVPGLAVLLLSLVGNLGGDGVRRLVATKG